MTALFWLIGDLTPHFLGGVESNFYLIFFDLVLNEKYLALIYWALLDDKNVPLTTKLITDKLFSKIIFCLVEFPWASIK